MCGVVFWLMAAPAVVLVLGGVRSSPRWSALYAVVGLIGVLLGFVGFRAIA